VNLFRRGGGAAGANLHPAGQTESGLVSRVPPKAKDRRGLWALRGGSRRSKAAGRYVDVLSRRKSLKGTGILDGRAMPLAEHADTLNESARTCEFQSAGARLAELFRVGHGREFFGRHGGRRLFVGSQNGIRRATPLRLSPVLPDRQKREAIKRRDHGEETLEIGRSYNVSGWTISMES
jgi:hypothetical protein